MAKERKHTAKEKKEEKENQPMKKSTAKKDPTINKHAKESGESKHNDIDQDNES